MSLVLNSYLSDKSLKIRSKAIPWDGYQRAGLLSAEDVGLIQRVVGSKDKAEPILDAEGETYAALYIRLLNKLSRNDTLQFILVLLGDFIADREDRIPLFLSPSSDSPYPLLLKLLDSQDDFVRLKAAVIASVLLSYDKDPQDEVVTKLLTHLSHLIRLPNEPESQDVGVQCLESVLRVQKARTVAWETENGDSKVPKVIEGLVQLLKSNPSPQMQYQLGFCFWLLSFDTPVAENINSKYNLIPLLLDLARSAIKEKILRIVLSTYRNLIIKAPKQTLPALLIAKVLPFVKTLQGRKFGDEEIKEDVDFLVEELTKSFEGLTTYDEYKSELATGHLTWSPPHKNDDFWRDNASKLTERDREQLKTLVKLLISSQEPLTLAVAANDIAQFVKFHDNGKKAIEDLGAKARVMELMAHGDPDVKYQSLVATQRLMSHAWQ
ncbi:H(+)-transporting V1 sector ATPase subunit H [Sporobolomyces salmoneus]|uniref:H(+)-transporting V1 sector ATPase subunit H n=1 Tax=Sporobolomyces salmoneus TaxID=183962 RepID=UPI003171F850